jgi:predicted methyltransferase
VPPSTRNCPPTWLGSRRRSDRRQRGGRRAILDPVRALVLAVALGSLAAACRPAAATPAPGPALVLDDPQRDAFRQPERLVALLALHPGQRVADVGAGDGYLTFRLAAAVGPQGHVLATDVDWVALLHLCERAVHLANVPPVALRLVSPSDPGLEAAGYDLVLLAQVDHYLADRVAYFRALRPALAPGGRLVLANRTPFQAAALAAAAAAGYTLAGPPDTSLPGQFVVSLVPTKESP